MALKNLVLDVGQTNGAKCCRQRQHATVRTCKLLIAELGNKSLRLKVKGKLLDTEVFQAIVDLKDVIDIKVAGIVGKTRLEPHTLGQQLVGGNLRRGIAQAGT